MKVADGVLGADVSTSRPACTWTDEKDVTYTLGWYGICCIINSYVIGTVKSTDQFSSLHNAHVKDLTQSRSQT